MVLCCLWGWKENPARAPRIRRNVIGQIFQRVSEYWSTARLCLFNKKKFIAATVLDSVYTTKKEFEKAALSFITIGPTVQLFENALHIVLVWNENILKQSFSNTRALR